MAKYNAPAFSSGRILLPGKGFDYSKWAVIACDQFTGNSEYWNECERIVGNAPSTLRITLPEIYLSESAKRTPLMCRQMENYSADVLETAVEDGFVFVKRSTSSGERLGLVGLIDLEEYSYDPNSKTLVRPTEKTIPERVPPRADIRKNAVIEVPHVMMLIDDPLYSVIEPLEKKSVSLNKLYDFDLMLGGGHIEGYAVTDDAARRVTDALNALYKNCGGLLFAVGDGNHSLAAAKSCYEQSKDPQARYAMVELVNIHSPALIFEPIHRVIYDKDERIAEEFMEFIAARGTSMSEGNDVRIVTQRGEACFGFVHYPLALVQEFLDRFEKVDYIHGEEDVYRLVDSGCTGILLKSISKSELLPYVRDHGVLPRKAFSMGEARDKRYYLECHAIR